MTYAMDSQYKEKLISTFRALVNFCESNQLSYFVGYGTALGAIRHHGMIPWDDDIDILMPRKDYEKLLSMPKPKGYACCDMHTNEYWAPFAKWINTNTTLWEEKTHPIVIGLYVDIFVLDEGNETALSQVVQVEDATNKLRRAYTHWSWSDIFGKLLKGHPMGFQRMLLDKIWYNHHRNRYREQLLNLQNVSKQQRGNFLVSINGPYKQKEIYPKTWFDSYLMVPFEDFQVRIAVEYDKYLERLYHNYMTPPPVDKRQSTHSHYYLNLDKCVSLEEIENVLFT